MNNTANRKWRKFMATLGWNIVMLAAALIFLVPLYWMVATSLKFEGDIMIIPPKILPIPATLSNFTELIAKFNFPLYFRNSLMVAILAMIGQAFSCSMAGYVFARLRFPLKRTLFYLLLATMMIPGQVTIIPQFIIFNWLKWVDSFLPLIVPAFMGGAFGTFLFRQFFLTVPKELEEAAYLDGCGYVSTFTRIFLPISKPTMATLMLFTFMNHWNDLLNPVIYLTDTSKRTITVALAMFQDSLRVSRGTIMSGAIISILPLLIAYLFVQRYFVAGMITSGLKG